MYQVHAQSAILREILRSKRRRTEHEDVVEVCVREHG